MLSLLSPTFYSLAMEPTSTHPKMASSMSRRTKSRTPHAQSIVSADSISTMTRPTPPPTTRRSGMNAMRAKSITSDTASYAEGLQLVPKVKIPAHFSLLPTVPNPFSGTLEASLDAILSWGSVHADTQAIVNVLLREVNRLTNWPELLSQIITDRNLPAGWGRYLVEELLFLVTRTLLPEQIAENRLAMGRLYERKKHLAIRLVLRYDMLREWKTDSSNHTIAVSSVPPGDFKAPPAPPSADAAICPNRRRLMPNVLSTLIAAPLGGFSTHGVRERMKHHVTDVDSYLLLSDDKVAAWNTGVLVEMTSQIILQWQWLRQNNETLQDMEVHGWEELDCKADECEWIADDVKKPSGGRKEKSGIAGAGTESTEAK